MCFVGELGGKKICIENSGRKEVIEILKDTWPITSSNVSNSQLDIQPCSVSDELLWSIDWDDLFVQCLESPKLAKPNVCYSIDNPCTQLDPKKECENLCNPYSDLYFDEWFYSFLDCGTSQSIGEPTFEI